jgi:hypothetical protein
LLSDGTTVDVTWLATWTSSAPAVAAVDAWGRLDAVAAGTADITATIAGAPSQPLALTVVERPTLQHIIVENVYCQIYAYPVDDPATGEPSRCRRPTRSCRRRTASRSYASAARSSSGRSASSTTATTTTSPTR